ncbi:MAG TPA: 3'-5' exonuclease, partial [Candidatus Binatus sp.]|nr:3'-5' exonuclease [Candidatus Binatus sp.]
MSSLDQYMVQPSRVEQRSEQQPVVAAGRESDVPSPALEFKPSIPFNLDDSFLVGAGYDGQRRTAYLKLYEPQSHRIHRWYDNTGHTSYCLSKESKAKLEKIQELTSHPGFLRMEESKRYDALAEKEIPVTVIFARDPLSIGGRLNSIREIGAVHAYEADIHYVLNYFYDRHLDPGMTYSIRNGRLEPGHQLETSQLSTKLAEGDEEYQRLMSRWLRLLDYPVPSYKRISLDIEVESPIETRVPDPTIADDRVICASLLPNDASGRVLLLRRVEVEEDTSSVHAPGNATVEWYDREEDLLTEIFLAMLEYPVFITFNGDDFDMRYLYNRAVKLGIPREKIPIELSRETTGLAYGLHFDLYRFFGIKAIQVYAFGSKYREISLDHISEMLLDRGKIPLEGHVTSLSYSELALYCYNDAELVLDMTRYDQEVILKIVTALSRINCVPPEDLSRQGVMAWVKSMMYKEHRDRGYIIPKSEDILRVKGESITKAIIRGKKYKGGIVVDPVPGVH